MRAVCADIATGLVELNDERDIEQQKHPTRPAPTKRMPMGFTLAILNSLYLQEVRGFTASHARLMTLPMAGMTGIFAPLSGCIVGARGTRPPLLVAGAGIAVSEAVADPNRPRHLNAVPLAGLFGIRIGLRNVERADHECRCVGYASGSGRGCGRDRVDESSGGCGDGGRGHRLGAVGAVSRNDPVRIRTGRGARLVDHRGLWRGGLRARFRHHQPLGAGDCGRGYARPARFRALRRPRRILVRRSSSANRFR